MKKPLLYGIAGSFFFAFTFLLNRSMNLSGGHWLFSASLRYLFTLPMIALPLLKDHQYRLVHEEIRKNPFDWILWSMVGFALFYVPMSFASARGESWLIAATWQLTIVAGVLLTPLFGKKIPLRNLGMSLIILLGVGLLQFRGGAVFHMREQGFVLLPIILGAVAYPLGNRKMMDLCKGRLSTLQRIYGMTLCSTPVWIVLAGIAWATSGPPSFGQIAQCILVALLSGVFATVLFFKATDLVKGHPQRLALVEATQSGEVVFTFLGGVLLLGDGMPGAVGFVGIVLILIGMVLSSLVTS
ncbi:multidrug resistance efflux transporter family protein [Lachnospiraceae bacterium ZAX-1]